MGYAAAKAQVATVRLYHLTFYKSGSQWVRDILTDPRVVECSGQKLAASGIDLQSERWPALEAGQLASPLYSTGTGEWSQIAQSGDRAFVVIRDPRDIVVSLVYSVSLSHTPTPITLLLREPLTEATPRNRILTGMYLLAQWAEYLRSWKRAHEFPNVFLTRYETLIADLPGELERLFRFAGWDVPRDVVQAVARDNSFETRSGRKPGVENQFSHRRKGVGGDWRNHFDRDLSRRFEEAFPSLLCQLGYEESEDWWRSRPLELAPAKPTAEQQRLNLLAVLAEHEKELAEVRRAAEDRLRDVGILHEIIAEQNSVSEELRAGMVRLSEELCEAVASREALRADLERTRAEALKRETSISWRFGYQPLRAVLSLFRPGVRKVR